MIEKEKNKVEASTLYLVATPIGNLSDITERAKKVLNEVDFIAAEDTRNSWKLLSYYGISKELVSYHEHNKKVGGERIVARLLNGESCALITDAGMPAISDPGEDIVKMCVDAGLCVSVIPGACAAVSALALSGLCTSKFVFEGFLSAKSGERRRRLEELKCERRTLIIYEAPHKLKATLSDLCEIFGAERKISLCREITKINEQVIRTSIGEALSLYEATEPRGEFVLVIDGCEKSNPNEQFSEFSAQERVENYISSGMSKMDAIKKTAKDMGVPKSEIYNIVSK